MTTYKAKVTAVLLAGGSGSRMEGSVSDKVLHPILGKPIWRHSFDAFEQSESIRNYVFVCRDSDQQQAIESNLEPSPRIQFATGGAQRQDSVWAGLQAAPVDSEAVLIHDLARPLITPQAIAKTADAALRIGAACVARKTTDTIKHCDPIGNNYHLKTIDRENLWSMETPQAFRFSLIMEAYREVIASGEVITDDLSAIEERSHPVAFIENPRPNPKLTTQKDLSYIEFLLNN